MHEFIDKIASVGVLYIKTILYLSSYFNIPYILDSTEEEHRGSPLKFPQICRITSTIEKLFQVFLIILMIISSTYNGLLKTFAKFLKIKLRIELDSYSNDPVVLDYNNKMTKVKSNLTGNLYVINHHAINLHGP